MQDLRAAARRHCKRRAHKYIYIYILHASDSQVSEVRSEVTCAIDTQEAPYYLYNRRGSN